MPKGKLEPGDKDKIILNFQYLVDEVDAKDILGACYEKELINTNEKEEIESINRPDGRTDKLLQCILNSGLGGYKLFLDVLKKDYPHVIDKLEATERDKKEKDGTSLQEILDEVKDAKHKYIEPKDVIRFAFCVTDGWKNLVLRLRFNKDEIEAEQMNSLDDVMCLCRCLNKWAERKKQGEQQATVQEQQQTTVQEQQQATVQDLVHIIDKTCGELKIDRERFRQALQMMGK